VPTHSWTIGWIHELGFAGSVHLLFFGAALPLLALRAAVRAKGNEPPLPDRSTYFKKTALSIAVLGVFSLLAAFDQGLTVFPARLPPTVAWPAAFGLYAVAVLCMRPRWRRAVRERPQRVQRFLASTPAERAW
jgi:hypothetical protein